MTGRQRRPVAMLSARQQTGIDCAACGAYLGVRSRPLGVAFHRGHFLYLYACAPACPPPPELPAPGAFPSPSAVAGRDRPPRDQPPPGAATTTQAADGQGLHPSPRRGQANVRHAR